MITACHAKPAFAQAWANAGLAWQAVITADPSNAVAGRGYFCNTTSGAFNLTLPTSATIGDSIAIIDYAGTFDTNNLTVATVKLFVSNVPA